VSLMKKYQGFLSLVAALIMVISWGIVAHAENMPEGLPLGPYFKTGTFVGTNSATTVEDTAGNSKGPIVFYDWPFAFQIAALLLRRFALC